MLVRVGLKVEWVFARAVTSIQTLIENKKNMNKVNQHRTKRLAALVYEKGLRAQIKEEIESKYEKRIEYLIGANNELMKELEMFEGEIITVSKEKILPDIPMNNETYDYNWKQDML